MERSLLRNSFILAVLIGLIAPIASDWLTAYSCPEFVSPLDELGFFPVLSAGCVGEAIGHIGMILTGAPGMLVDGAMFAATALLWIVTGGRVAIDTHEGWLLWFHYLVYRIVNLWVYWRAIWWLLKRREDRRGIA